MVSGHTRDGYMIQNSSRGADGGAAPIAARVVAYREKGLMRGRTKAQVGLEGPLTSSAFRR
jgi:hypothetical protein